MHGSKKFLVTAALPYSNGPLHIGHLAGAYLPADIYARHLRGLGKEVLFVCGSDEHGAAITLRAKKEGTSPQEIVDKYHRIIEESFEKLGMSFDIYHRTSSELHHQTASDFFKELYDKNIFEKIESEQFYDEEHQQFLADRYIKGTCPKCGYNNAYGDQCEKCGSSLSPSELIDPVSVLSGKKPILKQTYHWYLPMQNHEKWLKEWLLEGKLDGKNHHDPNTWKKNVLGQCMSWVDNGLQSRAMTRDLDWGVKVPLKGEDGKVLYVWLDAPIGYISASKQWALNTGGDWRDYWQNDDTQLIHFIGKDNIVFHCIIFPIILKAHGLYNLPVNVPANEFLNLEGEKISTSRNWAVWIDQYLIDFNGKEDELRYVLTSIAPEQKDSEFTWNDFQARVNNELVAIYGNFVNRCMVLSQKYYDGKVPQRKELNTIDELAISEAKKAYEKINERILKYKFRDAISEAMQIARIGNKYLADQEPWKLVKTDPERVKTIMNIGLQLTALLSKSFSSFLPHSSKKLQEMLEWSDENFDVNNFEFLPAAHQLGAPQLLFEKITDEQIAFQKQKLVDAAKSNTPVPYEPLKENVVYDDFVKLDIRVGEIKAAEKVKLADKLLQLEVDLGFEKRTIVSGIAKFFTGEEIIGKKVCVVANLAPKKLRGIESSGMILMGENSDGNLAFIEPQSGLKPGDIIR